ncbi:zincin [Aureobasidium subglaciale]|nr:zincin [Aureobasidium subglaciale]
MTGSHPPPPQPCPKLISTHEILPLTKQQINTSRRVRDKVIGSVTPSEATYETVVRPLANAQHAVQHSVGVIETYLYAAPDAETREAAQEAMSLWNGYATELNSCHGLYTLLQAVKDRNEVLDAESTRYLDHMLAGFIRCGHGSLDPAQIVEYTERSNTIEHLCNKFCQNVRNASDGIWLSKAELDGVPEPDLIQFKTAAEAILDSSQDNDKPDRKEYFVSSSRHNSLTVLQYAKSSKVRKRMCIANHSKLPEHLALFKEIVLLRDKNARLLGYLSHAAYRVERSLAKTTTWVNNFMDRLEHNLLPRGKMELEQIIALKIKHTSGSEYVPSTIDVWDFQFWKRLALEGISIDQDKIAEYFPMKQVVEHMLKLFSDCLQMRFKKFFPPVWHPDVEAWEVWDDRSEREHEFVGYLYMDLVFRHGKHRGCQDVNMQSSYIDSTGKRVYPSTLLMCNFPPLSPRGNESCMLLKHSQIVSLFHELGHGMHDLLSRTQYSVFHGWHSPPDYAEALSIMLENWCWLPDELKKLSCHYTAINSELVEAWKMQNPGKELPQKAISDDLVVPLTENRYAFRSLYLLEQLAHARFDMAVHDPPSHEACLALDPTTVYTSLLTRLTLLSTSSPSDWGHKQTDFTQLLAGYDAGYYSYLSAQVFAKDLYAQFAHDPRSRETWERYRSDVLEQGAGREEMQNLEAFLGRSPSVGLF